MFLPSCNCSGVYFPFTNPCLQITSRRSCSTITVLFFPNTSRPNLGSAQLKFPGTDCSVPGRNWPAHEAVYSSPSSAIRRAIWPSIELISYFCLYMYVCSLLSRHRKLLFYCKVFRLYLPLFVLVAFHDGCSLPLSCLSFLLMSHLERYFSLCLSPTVPSLLPFH